MIYYLLTIVDNLHGIMVAFSIVFGAALFAMTVINFVHIVDNLDDIRQNRYLQYNENSLRRKLFSKLNKISAVLFAISLSFTVFLPSSKGIAFIYIAPKIVENGDVKETFANIPELAKLGTEYLKDLLKEKVKDDGQRDSNSTHNN